MKQYDFPNLISPIKIGKQEFKSRINFSPTYSFFATKDNQANQALGEWIRPLAAGGANCVPIGTGVINPLPPFITHVVSVADDTCVNHLSQLFAIVHAYDCKAGIELVPLDPDPEPFDLRDKKGKPQIEVDPDNYTNEQVKEFIKFYADAAERVLKAGGDMVVVHGAHMQPPAAFFSKAYNHRTDEYGAQNFENRTRFTVELLDGIRARVGDKLLIEYRISWTDMWENSPDMNELIQFTRLIQGKIDWLHVSRGQLGVHKLTPYVFPPLYFERGFNLDAAAQFKAALDIPVSCVGGMDYEIAEKAIADGKIDMVEFCRPLLADPDIPVKLRRNAAEEIRPCIRCNNCIHRTHNYFLPVRCAVNAYVGRELIFQNYQSPKESRKVAVIGGGPGGMEAARIAAERGHKVVLYEASDKLGGTLLVAAAPEFKGDIKKYLNWSIRMTTSNKNITVKLNTTVSPESIEKENYDAVIVAVGSDPIIPGFVKDNPKVALVSEVELGMVATGERVIVAGAGMAGMEVAINLAKSGKKVTLIDMVKAENTGQGGTKMNIIALKEMLVHAKVEIMGETKLEGITGNGIEVSCKDKSRKELLCDTLVLSLGVRPRRDLAYSFRQACITVIPVGDCNTDQGTLFNAVTTAYDAAMSIV
ncbi:FAD-dependent oxidoreductase [Treponema sp. TIM-1]|uniref:oxidoreductase n=1 Tax=Treponema sp. TIM-1 TaxID=2898417 RepID=UPI00397FD0DF